jgi:septal ring factor EnvC (AmiA/AmiB activator)
MKKKRADQIQSRSFEVRKGLLAVNVLLALCVLAPAAAKDRQEELEGLRDAIHDSRERVTEHEAGERAILEQLEEVDRRLQTVSRDRQTAGRDVAAARRRLAEVEPKLAVAQTALSGTQRALAARAVALYRGGEVGPVRIIFSADSLPELLSRASALRLLVRHDAKLVARYGEEHDRLEALEAEANLAVDEREVADARLTQLVAKLKVERMAKGKILTGLRKDRKSERRLLLELEQAAQALEETIRTLGSRADHAGEGVVSSGFARRRGELVPPVDAKVAEPFGRVVDPEFQTTTFRSGVDFAASAGTSVRSVASGVVRFSGWFRGYGRIVIVDHGDAFHSISGHLDEIFVEVGNPVKEGQALGTVGETGSLGGPSLYFELRRDGEPVDPEGWLLDARG